MNRLTIQIGGTTCIDIDVASRDTSDTLDAASGAVNMNADANGVASDVVNMIANANGAVNDAVGETADAKAAGDQWN